MISFGSAILPPDRQCLQQIANENGGRYFPQTDSSNLQALVNQIASALRGGRTVAAARVRKLTASMRQGSTFLVIRLSALVRGTLRFNVRATKIGSGGAGVKLTSQVSQRR